MASDPKVAVVVGASRGIGYASAVGLAKAGADVVVAARTERDLKPLAQSIETVGRRSLAIKVDVKKKSDIEALIRATLKQFGKIDVLVYSSGVAFPEKTLAESTDEHFEETVAVNLRGAFWAMRGVLTLGKMLERRSGRIILIGSDSSKRGDAGLAVYAATKHAILGLARCLAWEVGPLGITVNVVCPGFVWTKMAQDLAPEFAKYYDVKQENIDEFLKGFDPLKRISTPEEIADMVVFLGLTPGGGAVTGQGYNMATATMS